MQQWRDERTDVRAFAEVAEPLVVFFQAPEIADGLLVLFEGAGIDGLRGEILADVALQFDAHGGHFVSAEELADKHDAVALVVVEELRAGFHLR